MRYQVNSVLFAVQFTQAWDLESERIATYSTPLLYSNEMPSKINLIKLSVAEHHKVPNEWDEKAKPVKDCDGYLLRDDNGLVYANQYPRASYGQTSDTANRRFCRYIENDGEDRSLINELKANPGRPYEYNLFTDALENMARGIEDLSAIDEQHEAYPRISEKLPLLKKLYDDCVA